MQGHGRTQLLERACVASDEEMPDIAIRIEAGCDLDCHSLGTPTEETVDQERHSSRWAARHGARVLRRDRDSIDRQPTRLAAPSPPPARCPTT